MAKQSLVSAYFKIIVTECECVNYSVCISIQCFAFFLNHSVQGYIFICMWLFFIQLAKAFCDTESCSCEKGSTKRETKLVCFRDF